MPTEPTPLAKALRHTLRLDKFNDGRTPDDGAPDETIVVRVWTEPDGAPIVDPARIAELEANLRIDQNEEDQPCL